jgi:phosphoribosylformimino-5-aminoimidazole carboxamide ribotide isomerase
MDKILTRQGKIPRLIPVVDIRGGIAVHAVAGKRQSYRPLASSLVSSVDPTEVGRSMIQATGACDLYVADLDAIESGRPNWAILAAMESLNVALWCDLGIRDVHDVHRWQLGAQSKMVVGLESLKSPGSLGDIVRSESPKRVAFSLDLRGGVPVTASADWVGEPMDVLEFAYQSGIRSVIILDLAVVGSGTGPATLDLCRQARSEWPELELVTGGGIRDWNDLENANAAGVSAALVASAIHSGAIGK